MRKTRVVAKTPEAGVALSGLAQVVREYVAGSTDFPYQQFQRALPRYVDDAERDFGSDLYERMLRDPMVRAHGRGSRRTATLRGEVPAGAGALPG